MKGAGRGSVRSAVLVNGAAGGGRAGALWTRIEEAVVKEHPSFERCLTLRPDSVAQARQMLRRHLPGLDRLFIVGGDGTANLVVDCVLAEGRGQDLELALIPAGTGSDFARTLGLPRDPAKALRRALSVQARPIDAIEVAVDDGPKRFCLNIASIGLSGAVDMAVNAKKERGSYLLATLGALWGYEPKPCRLEVDGEAFVDGAFLVVACANGKYFGKGMKVAPDAEIDDGLLDIVFVPPVPRWQLPWKMPLFLVGRHIHLHQVLVRRARTLRVVPPEGFFPFDLDGETLDSGPATFSVLPGALRFLA